MNTRKLDKDSPSMKPHGDILKVPGGTGREEDKQDEKGIDVPAEPGRPTPGPSSPDLPGGPAQPVDPGKPPTL